MLFPIYHWKECSICSPAYVDAGRPNDSVWTNDYLEFKINANGLRVLAIKDSFTEHAWASQYWSLGNSCRDTNVYVSVCNCGYAYKDTEKPKPVEHNYVLIPHISVNTHAWRCSKCAQVRDHTVCTNAAGNYLGCKGNRSGTCAVCGASVANEHVWNSGNYVNPTNGIHCLVCGQELNVIISYDVDYSNSPNNVLTVTYEYDRQWDSFTNSGAGVGSEGLSYLTYSSGGLTTTDNRIVTGSINFKFKKRVDNSVIIQLARKTRVKFPGVKKWYVANYIRVYPEQNPPTLNVVQSSDSYHNGWATNTTIKVSGTEDYCYSVNIKMIDKTTNEIIYQGTAAVTNKNYSLSFVPLLSVDENGKDYEIIVADEFGSSSTETIHISKTDVEPPMFNQSNQTITTEGIDMWSTPVEWSRTKDFDITASDDGTNILEMKIQNVKSKKTGNVFSDTYGITTVDNGVEPSQYTRKYTFTGDVKGYITLKANAYDHANNVTNKFFRVYNLDNTLPTISNVDYIGSSSRRISATLSDAYSGIKYFGIISAENGIVYPTVFVNGTTSLADSLDKWYQVPLIPGNISAGIPESGQDFVTVNLNIPSAGRYYIVTEDYVGNRNYYEFNANRFEIIPPYGVIHTDITSPDGKVEADIIKISKSSNHVLDLSLFYEGNLEEPYVEIELLSKLSDSSYQSLSNFSIYMTAINSGESTNLPFVDSTDLNVHKAYKLENVVGGENIQLDFLSGIANGTYKINLSLKDKNDNVFAEENIIVEIS